MSGKSLVFVTLTAFLNLPVVAPAQQLEKYTFLHQQMGTRFQILLYSRSDSLAELAARKAMLKIDALNSIFSDYDEHSELHLLSGSAGTGKKVKVSSDLWKVLRFSHKISRKSHGAFDITIGPLSKLWRRAFRLGEFPDMQRIAETKKKVNYRFLKLNPGDTTVQLSRTGMQLDAGGIAKGYAVDEALKVLKQHGISQALVDGGGDIAAGAPPPGRESWTIAIELPGDMLKTLTIAERAVATSGSAYRNLENEGQRYSHIIDPKSGMGVTHFYQVTVEAPDCITADALASALSVLGPEKGRRLMKKFRDCRFSFINIQNSKNE